MPALPESDADGHFPAMECPRISLARSIICERTALGLTQEQLAKLAGGARRVGVEKRAEKVRAGIITKSEDAMTIHQRTALAEHVGEFIATMRAAGRSLAESRSSGAAAFESAAAETSTRPRDS